MKTSFACAAFAAVLLGLGTAASADDAMTAKPAMPAHMATMICRAADPGEKATAMMGTKPLVCNPVNADNIMKMKKMSDAMPNGDPIWVMMLNDLTIKPSNN
jgi:hypothetical protein